MTYNLQLNYHFYSFNQHQVTSTFNKYKVLLTVEVRHMTQWFKVLKLKHFFSSDTMSQFYTRSQVPDSYRAGAESRASVNRTGAESRASLAIGIPSSWGPPPSYSSIDFGERQNPIPNAVDTTHHTQSRRLESRLSWQHIHFYSVVCFKMNWYFFNSHYSYRKQDIDKFGILSCIRH